MPSLNNLTGELAQSEKTRTDHEGIQAWRGKLNAGLVLYPLDFATYTVTAGDDSADTFRPFVNGVALCAAVPWDTSDDATADALVAAINAAAANHDYWAIKTDTDDFSVYQRRHGGAAVFTMTEVGDADGTLVDFTAAGAIAAITVVSGETDNIPATYAYYELGIDNSTAYDLDGTPRVGKTDIQTGESEPWQWWRGFFNPDDVTPTNGHAVAAETEESLPMPFLNDPAKTGYIIYTGGAATASYVNWSV